MYLQGFQRSTVDATVISFPAEHGSRRQDHLTFTQTKAKRGSGSNGLKLDSSSLLVSAQEYSAHTTNKSGTNAHNSTSQSFTYNEVKTIRHATPPQQSPNYVPSQSIHDRTPPTPPPLPESWQPWYLIYAPEVSWAKLDIRENVELRQDLEHLSEGSQGRASASRTTPTSIGGLSRTPSKNRMRMVPAGQRDRSRSRRATLDAGDESDHSKSEGKAEEEEGDDSDSSVEVTSTSSSGSSESDHEETDGTDSEVEELLAFKKATRRFTEIRYPDPRTASTSSLIIHCKKRKLLLEESLPDTYGPRHASRLSRTIIDAAKPGTGPRAVARKSFARAIGARLLAKKSQNGKT